MVIGFDEEGNACEEWGRPPPWLRSDYLDPHSRLMRAAQRASSVFRGAGRAIQRFGQAMRGDFEEAPAPAEDDDGLPPHHAHNMRARASWMLPMAQPRPAPAHASYIHQRRRQELRRLHPLR